MLTPELRKRIEDHIIHSRQLYPNNCTHPDFIPNWMAALLQEIDRLQEGLNNSKEEK